MTRPPQRYLQQRVSRRQLLRAAGGTAAVLSLLPLTGCSGTGASRNGGGVATATSVPDRPDILNPGPPRRGGTFATSEAADFGTFDPHLGIALASAYFPRLYNVLVNQSATKPAYFYFDLASSYENPDAATFVFKVRPGVKVGPNDLGVPERDLDGEDVRVNLARIKSTPEANNYAFAHEYIDNVAVAGDAVTIRTTKPYAWFMNRIGLFFNTIAPRELLAGDLSRLTQRAAGAGPFRLISVAQGQRAVFQRNPNYYRKDRATGDQLPYVDGIDLRVIFDRSAAHTAFESGQLQRYVPGDAGEARSLAPTYVIARDPNFAFVSFTMNARQKPFDDPRVRRAFSRAINRQDYVDIIYGGDAKPDGLVHWPLGSYALDPRDLAKTYQPFDLQDAKRLVSAVGGIRVKMMYPADALIEEHNRHLPIFLGQMEAAGIQIDRDPQAFSTWVANYSKVQYQCSLALNQTYETPELPLGFHTAAGPLGDGSYVRGLGDPEIEAAVKKANETLDLNARIATVHEAQRVIYAKDPILLPLVTPYMYQAYWKTVRNIPYGVGTTSYFLNTFSLDR
ncbi:MAG: ABC transporter substrate-binding protein [Dehalococcoidia bacterium]